MESSYAYILAAFLGWFIAQIIKNLLNMADLQKSKGFSKYLSSGDMPSAHTATVIALTSSIFFSQGVSDLFALASVFSAITIYDALVARRSIGEQGVALLRLIEKSTFAKDPLPKVALGHKPLEVLVGAVLGTGVGAIVAIFITI
jgi:acid phosphatase family membrane protein YuiD